MTRIERRRQTLYCELCGAPIQGQAYRVTIDGVEMVVCYNCYKRYLEKMRSAPKPAPNPKLSQPQPLLSASRAQTAIAPKRSNTKAPTMLRPYFTKRRITSKQPKTTDKQAMVYEVVDDYAIRVRRARERLGWTQKMLAERVRESENVIKRIELGKLKPTIDLARRLEKVLGIKLLEPVVDETLGEPSKNNKFYLTLGDIASIRED